MDRVLRRHSRVVRTGQASSSGLAAVTAGRLRSTTVCSCQAEHTPSRHGSCGHYALSPLLSSARQVSAWLPFPARLRSLGSPLPPLDGLLPVHSLEKESRVAPVAVAAALDALLKAYHNPAAVRWGPEVHERACRRHGQPAR
jgi:hypothetical protein